MTRPQLWNTNTGSSKFKLAGNHFKPIFIGILSVLSLLSLDYIIDVAREPTGNGVAGQGVQQKVAKNLVNNQNSTLHEIFLNNTSVPTSTYSSEVPKKRMPAESASHQSSMQIRAQEVLEKMKEQSVFDTPITTLQSVIERGFPVNWDNCTIQNILDRKANHSETLQIVLLGGSCSARSANNCAIDGPFGRYSDYLQQSIGADSLPFQLVNMAQGNTNSLQNGLTMDVLVDPHRADVLIWEYALNDGWSLDELPVRYLQFWLARVDFLYAKAGRPRPPILMVLLYEKSIGSPEKRSRILESGLDTPWQQGQRWVQHFSRLGWNLQVVSLGSAVTNVTAVADNPLLMLDDVHHPNCRFVQVISDLLRYALLTNLATCENGSPKNATSLEIPTNPSRPKKKTNKIPHLLVGVPNNYRGLWELLLNTNVRIGSLTPWLPRLKDSTYSNLRLGNVEDIEKLPVSNTERAEPARADRKMGFVMEKCSKQGSWSDVVLLEPSLEWLGLDHQDRLATYLTINGISIGIDQSYYARSGTEMKTWVNVREQVGVAEKYTVSLCNHNVSRGEVFLRQMVGVMSPENTI